MSHGGKFVIPLLHMPTTYGSEDNGTWCLTTWGARDQFPTVVYIKTRNTPSGHVEVHTTSYATMYTDRTIQSVSGFGNEQDGFWLMAGSLSFQRRDLAFIKMIDNGEAEVHIASGSSDYKEVKHYTSSLTSDYSATWLLDGLYSNPPFGEDLICIKTDNTASGRVELHIATAASGFQQASSPIVTFFPTTFAKQSNATWLLADWNKDGHKDLVCIRTTNTESKLVEVDIVSGKSDFQTHILRGAPTMYGVGSRGTWMMKDCNNDGILDLVYLSPFDTGTKHVEVHVAAGDMSG